MVQEYRAKVFKSGNSLAIRLPKGLGAVAGTEMRARAERGTFTFEPADAPKRKIDLSGIWGSCPGLKPVAREEREFDPSPGVRDDPAWPGFPDETGA